jgi:hypothetical protein
LFVIKMVAAAGNSSTNDALVLERTLHLTDIAGM